MGIYQFYQRWIEKHDQTPSIFNFPNPPRSVNSFLIDLTSIIHRTTQLYYGYGATQTEELNLLNQESLRHKTPEEIHQGYFSFFFAQLQAFITNISPRYLLVIVVDGIVPQAQINNFRQKSFLPPSCNPYFNPNSIFPGTQFMVQLDHYLQEWINSPVCQSILTMDKVIYSSHLVPGDAKDKIMDIVRKGIGEGPHIIYYSESEMILHNLLTHSDKMYLMREFLNSTNGANEVVYFSMDNFSHYLLSYQVFALEDFVILSLFAGNEIIPSQAMLINVEYLDTFLEIYRQHNQPIYTTEINWEILAEILKDVQRHEAGTILSETPTLPDGLPRLINHLIEEIPPSSLDRRFQAFLTKWYYHYFLLPSTAPITPEMIQNLCFNYLYGLRWIFTYYQKGIRAIDIRWSYSDYFAPLLFDLISIMSPEILQQLSKITFASIPPLSLFIQSLMILPYLSWNILPQDFLSVLLPRLPPSSEILDQNYLFQVSQDQNGKIVNLDLSTQVCRISATETVPSILLLPRVNPDDFISFFDNLHLPDEYLNHYRGTEKIILKRSTEIVEVPETSLPPYPSRRFISRQKVRQPPKLTLNPSDRDRIQRWRNSEKLM